MVLSTTAVGRKGGKEVRRPPGCRKKAERFLIKHYCRRQALQQLAHSPDLSEKAQERLLGMLEQCEQQIALAPVLDDESLLVALKYLLELVQEEVIDHQPTLGETQRIAILNSSIRYVGRHMARNHTPMCKRRLSEEVAPHILAARSKMGVDLYRG